MAKAPIVMSDLPLLIARFPVQNCNVTFQPTLRHLGDSRNRGRIGGFWPLTAAALSSVLADSLDESFGHRTLLARELIHTGAQVRTQLSSRIGNIADVAELVEGVTVVLEDRRREEFSGADRTYAC